MKKTLLTLALGLTLALSAATSASADPIYVGGGGECPSDAQMGGDNVRQYYVTGALACVWDDDYSKNIKGDADDVAAYFLAGNWVGLGQDDNDKEFIDGFDSSAWVGATSGTFTIGAPLTDTYNQFAIGIKDGAKPYWAIFLLDVDVLTGDWGFNSQGGSLSHFTLYGRAAATSRCTDFAACPTTTSVPDGGATIGLLGLGMVGLGYLRRRMF